MEELKGKIFYEKGLNAFKNEDYEHVFIKLNNNLFIILKGIKILY